MRTRGWLQREPFADLGEKYRRYGEVRDEDRDGEKHRSFICGSTPKKIPVLLILKDNT